MYQGQNQQQQGGAKLPQDVHVVPKTQQQGHTTFGATGQQQQQQQQQVGAQGAIIAQQASSQKSAGGGLERKPSLQRQHATQVRSLRGAENL